MHSALPVSISGLDLSEEQFRSVSSLVYRICGINLHAGKFGLVRTRLGSRLRELGLRDIDSYLELVADDTSGGELTQLVDALTTNKTSFFREPKHFALLRERLLDELTIPGRPLRIWSAGCSSGEEAYTLAMVLLDELGDGVDARILATDISARMLTRARDGVYGEDAMDGVPGVLRQRYFRCVVPTRPRSYEVAAELRARIRFAQLNLMAPWPMRQPFDLICCRNVMIYFDKPTQQRLVDRFWDMLTPGGYFFAGHSESFAALRHGFRAVQPAVYQRPA
jgi:chemotaxis protein methyltransferase CheR